MRIARRPIGWAEMRATVTARFDIERQSQALKTAPERFEAFREEYEFRQEYF